MKNEELVQALLELSAATHKAANAAQRASDPQLRNELRNLGWVVARLISQAASEHGVGSWLDRERPC